MIPCSVPQALGRNTRVDTGRHRAELLAGTLVACVSVPRTRRRCRSRDPWSTQEAIGNEDSVRPIVPAYEEGSVAIDVATQHLADLIEPTGGFAIQEAHDPEAQELF